MTKFGRPLAISVITLLPDLTNAMAQTGPSFNTLYSFGAPGDGYDIEMITLGPGGVLYGTTVGGQLGSVYSLTPPASPGGSWTETILHDFAGGSDGALPTGLVIGSGGVLYGATNGGGATNSGTLYSLTPPASPGGFWTETVLYTVGNVRAGARPSVPVVGADGVLYCTSNLGGKYGVGTVFSLSPPSSPGGAWTQHVHYSFKGDPDAAGPQGLSAIGGVLYGTTTGGGSANLGTVFSLTPSSNPGEPWIETVINSFMGGNDGETPHSGLAGDSKGVLYGTANGGSQDSGMVYTLTPPASPGGSWTKNARYAFSGGRDSSTPIGLLAIGSGGVVYGTTDGGGVDEGVVCALVPPASPGGSWTQAVLHRFDGADGAAPMYGVVFGHGALFGTTTTAGPNSSGTVFSITP